MLLDGKMVSSCIALAVFADGREVTTVEGLAGDERLHPVQQAFMDCGGFQCGICTPGQVVAAKALLDTVENPTEAEIKEWMLGNLCRCTGYYKIVESIQAAARAVRAVNAFDYRAPRTVDEVLALLQEHGDDARVIAGGTALVTMMRQRLVLPDCLVSLRDVEGLGGIEAANGAIRLGALVTHREAEVSPLVTERAARPRGDVPSRGDGAHPPHGHGRRLARARRSQPGPAGDPHGARRAASRSGAPAAGASCRSARSSATTTRPRSNRASWSPR